MSFSTDPWYWVFIISTSIIFSVLTNLLTNWTVRKYENWKIKVDNESRNYND